MTAAHVSKTLGYDDSPQWVAAAALRALAQREHPVARTMHACQRFGGTLWGVYVLRSERSEIPAAWVVDAPSLDAADEIHRRLWNQDLAPFLLLATPDGVRVCTGFRYGSPDQPDAQRGVLHSALALDALGTALDDLRAEQLDAGVPWRSRAASLTGEHRVDVRLLSNLRLLRDRLLHDGLAATTAHALIGRFLYLRHLLDRGLLPVLGVDPVNALNRSATVRGLRRLVEAIDDRLNGEVFPLTWTGERAPHDRHVQAVASAFLGDDVKTGQMHLDFRAYDFSYLPVETLSNVYEQFLERHEDEKQARKKDDGPTRHEAGAYYTPVSLVNYVLDELDAARPMTAATRVLDPSCGSGAFLVQCYRRLVTRWRAENPDVPPSAAKLRDLLTAHVFGIDHNEDACRVTEFSLVLALLDHLPDAELTLSRGFKLPTLHERNIFVGDFFDPSGAWRALRKDGFDWIVGNPPWVTTSEKGQGHARAWAAREENEGLPLVDKRVAEAFAWEAPRHLRADGRVGFVMPGMTLFADDPSFRQRFFAEKAVDAVTNLANLRRVLFDGRASQPAAVFLYGAGAPEGDDPRTCVYSPMLLHQAATVGTERKRARVWSLSLNQSEVRVLRQAELARGEALTWKVAMWGSPRDERLLRRMAKRCGLTLGQLAKQRGWSVGTGVMFPSEGASKTGYKPAPSLVDRECMDVEKARQGKFIDRVDGETFKVPASRAYTRRSGGLRVSSGPHVIVDANGLFARFVIGEQLVPHPHIGIATSPGDQALLRGVARLLASRVARYLCFLTSPQQGVRGGRITLESVLSLPVPNVIFEEGSLERLLEIDCAGVALDRAVASMYGLRETDRWLIDDLIDVKLHLVDGLTRLEATAPPDDEALLRYADALRQTLDGFYDAHRGVHHGVTVVRGAEYASAQVERVEKAPFARVTDADGDVARALRRVHARVRRDHPQWIYFDRNLRVYDADAVWFFKPLQRCEWTRSQALTDADTLIGEALAAGRPT